MVLYSGRCFINRSVRFEVVIDFSFWYVVYFWDFGDGFLVEDTEEFWVDYFYL